MKRKQNFWMLMVTLLLTLSLFGGVFAAAEEGGSEETPVNTKTFEFKTSTKDVEYTLEELSLTDLFTVEAVAGGTAGVTASGDAELYMFSHVYLSQYDSPVSLQKSYTFQVDFRSTASANGAIFVRAVDPQAYTITNPLWNADQTFGFFEWDYYAETDGAGASGSGGSGIKVFHTDSKIYVGLKLYAEDGLHITGQNVEFDFPEGFKAGELNTYKFVDNGVSQVEIFVNDVLLCTVEYGGKPAPYPDGDDGDVDILYYKDAAIKGADGTELLRVNNARICAEYSTVAIGNRDNTTYFNNLVLTYETDAPSGDKEPTETENTGATETKEPSENTKAPDNSTAGTTGTAGTPTADPGSKDTGNKDGGAPVALIIGICAAVAVAAIVVIIVALRKKK